MCAICIFGNDPRVCKVKKKKKKKSQCLSAKCIPLWIDIKIKSYK